jgi:hypothetical protein
MTFLERTVNGQGITGRFRSLPVWRPAPVAGAVLGDLPRYLLAAVLVTVLGLVIGYRPAGGTPGVQAGTGLLLVFALCLSWAWTALSLVLRTAQAVMSTGTVVLFPLTLASKVFVQPRTMPGGCRRTSASTRSATWLPPSAACWPATGRRPDRLGAARRRPARRLRPAHRLPLRPARLTGRPGTALRRRPRPGA